MKSYEITDKGYYYLGQSSLESNQLNDALKWLKLGLKQYEAIDPHKTCA
jgi:hypothetical protein